MAVWKVRACGVSATFTIIMSYECSLRIHTVEEPSLYEGSGGLNKAAKFSPFIFLQH